MKKIIYLLLFLPLWAIGQTPTENLKSKTIDGVSISIGVNYKYDNEKKEKDLKQGENLLTFDSTTENDDNISHINSMEISQEGKKTKFLTGKPEQFMIADKTITLFFMNQCTC